MTSGVGPNVIMSVVKLDLKDVFIVIFSICEHIDLVIIDFGFGSFKRINFSNPLPIKCMSLTSLDVKST